MVQIQPDAIKQAPTTPGSTGVEKAIARLGDGVLAHPANGALRDRLRTGDLKPDDLQRQLLRVVFRMLFLLVAESRGLLLTTNTTPEARQLCRVFDSLKRLRRLARDRQGGDHGDLWQTLLVTMSALDTGDDDAERTTREALGPTLLGSALWSQREIADVSSASVDNANLLEAVRCLAFVRDEAGVLRQVDYQNLGTEEWGPVYESLLELRADADPDERTFSLVTATGSHRKATGSYYTPTGLVENLLDWTLDPAINSALSADDPENALLDLKILDPACGSGYFLTAAARRVGSALAGLRSTHPNPPDEETEFAVREVVEKCIFGVDIDPIAVELCKVALWLCSRSKDLPASNLRCGNSLLGLTPKLLAEGDFNETDVAQAEDDEFGANTWERQNEYRWFHWHLEFPDVFEGDQANPSTGWFGGFDVIVGNPPFLNQLETTTAQSKKLAAFLKRRYPGVAKGYTDTAVIFAELSSQLVRPDGGRVGLVQPASILASADAIGARRALADRGTLETLWVAGERVFDASVLTCAVVFRNGAKHAIQEVRRFKGLDFYKLAPLSVGTDEIRDMDTWAPLIADGFGIPRVDLDQSRTMGEVLAATADFRDQYYGLAAFVEEADGRVPDGVSSAALVTTGLIDPANLLWGKRPTKFNKTNYNAPVVDLNRLRADGDLGDWAASRLVPKLLLATQTRVIEVVVDQSGVLLPSVPVITVTTHDISLWHAAAAVMSPPITAWAPARYMGAALSIDALKLSASQVHGLPLPPASAAWDRTARLIRDAGNSTSPERHREKLVEAGALMCDAYGILEADELMTWWRNRLPKERSL